MADARDGLWLMLGDGLWLMLGDGLSLYLFSLRIQLGFSLGDQQHYKLLKYSFGSSYLWESSPCHWTRTMQTAVDAQWKSDWTKDG